MTERVVITTKLGQVEIVATSMQHLSVQASNGGTPARNLTVRGIPYHVHAHLFLWADGTWNLGKEEEREYDRARNLYVTRTDAGHWGQDASESARKAITAALLDSVREWVQGPNAKSVIVAGTRMYAGFALSRIDNSLSDARAKVAELESERASVRAMLDGLPND